MPPDVARVLVLGRLLLVGALGGAVVGLVCGVTLTLVTGDVRAWGGWAAALAASLGLVAGPLAQAVTAIVVLRSGGTGPVARGAAVVVPALLALGLSLAVLSRLSTSQPGQGIVAAVAAGTTAVVAVVTRGWCLAPVTPARPAR